MKGDVVFVSKRPGEPDITHADITKARKMLGWEPGVTIEEGIKKLMEHIKDFENAPVWTPESIKETTKTWFTYLKD